MLNNPSGYDLKVHGREFPNCGKCGGLQGADHIFDGRDKCYCLTEIQSVVWRDIESFPQKCISGSSSSAKLYLVVSNGEVEIGAFHEGSWCDPQDVTEPMRPTHWAPLPEPPKGNWR